MKKKEIRRFISLLLGVVVLFSPVFLVIRWKKMNDLQLDLISAIEREDREKIKVLVESGARLNDFKFMEIDLDSCYNPHNYPGAWDKISCLYEEVEFSREMPQEGLSKKMSALHVYYLSKMSGKKVSSSFVKFLKSLGAKEDFFSAAASGDFNVLKKEIEAHPDFILDKEYSGLALVEATIFGQEKVLEFLLKKGVDPNYQKPPFDSSPLDLSVDYGQIDAARKLLEFKGKFLRKNPHPIVMASILGYPEFIALIVDNALPISEGVVSESYSNAISMYSRQDNGIVNRDKSKFVKFVKEMGKAGLDVNSRDSKKSNQTPMHEAAKLGNPDILKLLFSMGGKVTSKTSLNETPLVWLIGGNTNASSTLNQRIECLNFLLESGAQINAKTNKGQTALDLAELYKHEEIVNVLKARGAKRGKELKP